MNSKIVIVFLGLTVSIIICSVQLVSSTPDTNFESLVGSRKRAFAEPATLVDNKDENFDQTVDKINKIISESKQASPGREILKTIARSLTKVENLTPDVSSKVKGDKKDVINSKKKDDNTIKAQKQDSDEEKTEMRSDSPDPTDILRKIFSVRGGKNSIENGLYDQLGLTVPTKLLGQKGDARKNFPFDLTDYIDKLTPGDDLDTDDILSRLKINRDDLDIDKLSRLNPLLREIVRRIKSDDFQSFIRLDDD